ncbi:MAG: hypothetical protein LBV38_07200 [Alistipes sp.]|jgi:hypothetical protein|nr:hypothetical protein [Alistipes sp.]
MKKILLFLAPVALAAGCSQEITLENPSMGGENPQELTTEVRTRSLTGAVYNEIVDAWMVPQPDPYTLENFQKAYDRLSTRKSAQTLNAQQMSEFASPKKLAPTHYALKIYPRDEAEQWRVETMDDVQVAYIPFDWVQLPAEEAAVAAALARTRSAANTFAEKSPYTVTYDYTNATDGGPTGPVTYQLPILYVVWPADKPLPDDLEYVIDYEVFLPRAAAQISSVTALNATTLPILENEAVSTALGIAPASISPTTRAAATNGAITGTIKVFDNVVNQTVPMPNLMIKHALGSNMVEDITDSTGYFSLEVAPVSNAIIFYLTFQDSHGRWKMTTENDTTIPIERGQYHYGYNPPQLGSTSLGEIIVNPDNRQTYEIYRAVNYFFNVQSDLPRYLRSEPLTIMADDSTDPSGSVRGYFTYSTFISPGGIVSELNPLIRIYNYSFTFDNHVIGIILHEIGHAEHCHNHPGRFGNTHNFIKESYASFFGWYLGEAYYRSIGWIKPSEDSNITGQTRQGWTKDTNYYNGRTNTGWYSPLFVDLVDNYNQRENGAYWPKDAIKNMSPQAISYAACYSSTWAECKIKLQSYIGTYYDSAEFEDLIEDFDNWAGW